MGRGEPRAHGGAEGQPYEDHRAQDPLRAIQRRDGHRRERYVSSPVMSYTTRKLIGALHSSLGSVAYQTPRTSPHIAALPDIPSLDLNGRVASPISPVRSMSPVSSTGATGGGSGPPSRRTSFSSQGRSSTPGGRTSRSSSRSTSFNLPNEAREVIRLDGRQPGDEVEFEEEMDEESAWPLLASDRA